MDLQQGSHQASQDNTFDPAGRNARRVDARLAVIAPANQSHRHAAVILRGVEIPVATSTPTF
jgi:hypothetical protein